MGWLGWEAIGKQQAHDQTYRGSPPLGVCRRTPKAGFKLARPRLATSQDFKEKEKENEHVVQKKRRVNRTTASTQPRTQREVDEQGSEGTFREPTLRASSGGHRSTVGALGLAGQRHGEVHPQSPSHACDFPRRMVEACETAGSPREPLW